MAKTGAWERNLAGRRPAFVCRREDNKFDDILIGRLKNTGAIYLDSRPSTDPVIYPFGRPEPASYLIAHRMMWTPVFSTPGPCRRASHPYPQPQSESLRLQTRRRSRVRGPSAT